MICWLKQKDCNHPKYHHCSQFSLRGKILQLKFPKLPVFLLAVEILPFSLHLLRFTVTERLIDEPPLRKRGGEILTISYATTWMQCTFQAARCTSSFSTWRQIGGFNVSLVYRRVPGQPETHRETPPQNNSKNKITTYESMIHTSFFTAAR